MRPQPLFKPTFAHVAARSLPDKSSDSALVAPRFAPSRDVEVSHEVIQMYGILYGLSVDDTDEKPPTAAVQRIMSNPTQADADVEAYRLHIAASRSSGPTTACSVPLSPPCYRTAAQVSDPFDPHTLYTSTDCVFSSQISEGYITHAVSHSSNTKRLDDTLIQTFFWRIFPVQGPPPPLLTLTQDLEFSKILT